jgi:hypothetical protein
MSARSYPVKIKAKPQFLSASPTLIITVITSSSYGIASLSTQLGVRHHREKLMEAEILNSLIEIKNTLKSSSPTWVPAAFALLGVFIAGFWQHLNSRVNLKAQNELKELEIRSQVVSKQRQQWMDQIRVISSEFLAEYDVIVSDFGRDRFPQASHDALYRSANEKGNLIFLMLNSQKDSQKQAMQAIASIQVIVELYQKEGAKEAQNKYDKYRNDYAQALLIGQIQPRSA